MLRATTDPILVLDADDHIQMLNPAAQKFFSGSGVDDRRLAAGRRWLRAVPGLDRQRRTGKSHEITWPGGKVVEVGRRGRAGPTCRVITFNDVEAIRELERVKNEVHRHGVARTEERR